ncbi:hypothetical protein B0H10DRAFT_2221589 [Mycena sp. CBHHK59/15]|nr:hypothetical protein B0H10DRAFT_2221589 [Mycena sp. CBHHK59/15]
MKSAFFAIAFAAFHVISSSASVVKRATINDVPRFLHPQVMLSTIDQGFNLNSRTPSFRFGHGHIFNSVFDSNNDGINTCDGAQLLVQNSVWANTTKAIYTLMLDLLWLLATTMEVQPTPVLPIGNFTMPPYPYTQIATANI